MVLGVEMFEEKILLSGWKMIAYAALAVAGMLIGIFRLDEIIARRNSGPKPPNRPMGHDAKGRTMFSDPDGKVWKQKRK